MIHTIMVRRWTYFTLATFCLLPLSSLSANDKAKPTPEQLEFFEKKIRPIFYDNCFNCHSADNKEAGGLRVDDINALLKAVIAAPLLYPASQTKAPLSNVSVTKTIRKRCPPIIASKRNRFVTSLNGLRMVRPGLNSNCPLTLINR